MPTAKKFGAFAGVFTPSILTILGVIMYMRLGWVVGQAGLIATIIMIVIAHVISLSTGLSISSIATDKKIQTGGIYYILSRSLGLPMGGAIGLTLTIGTALSISLYIVGFTESFLAIESIRSFLHLGTGINDFRIVGSAVIIILVIIAFISTSLAIKAQFFILGAIALSLVSIFVGFGLNSEGVEIGALMLAPLTDGAPLEYVFAIFFPAVTGFTAGVAMSGDLKDPRKDIPVGTMVAILVGFIVYVGLAISFSLFVNRDMLSNDTNFLLKVSWLPPLVIAGIWGATLSSALGGILGAPRILQAISKDKITPSVLAKGYGASNEPRNALLFIFLVAEGGILVGDLNIIAGIVSMFYLASYGFINLSFSLESWASSDFRPSFKIPQLIGWIGFIACFLVMFQIDMRSMFIALIIIFGIYFYLKRRKLQLDFGDVWQSVYSTVVRKALTKMESGNIEKRNWRPNIILFSGGSNARPYLIKLGKSLLGRHGLLSNFDLIESPSAKVLFAKHEQALATDDSNYEGVFTRRQACRDIYEGIETIAGTYGFSGIEPNTVLMGWARQTKDPKRFGGMMRTLSDLDLSVLMVDYHEELGFGKKKQIDLWWRGAGNNGNMALSLIRFLQESGEWHNAKVRLLIINPKNEEADSILSKTKTILESFRVEAEIRVINNKIENDSFETIMQRESAKSDLTILGIPDMQAGDEECFVNRISNLTKNIGTVLLIKASTYFRDLYIVRKEEIEEEETEKEIENLNGVLKLDADLPNDPILADKMSFIQDHLNSCLEHHYASSISKITSTNNGLLNDFKDLVSLNFEKMLKELGRITNPEVKDKIARKYHHIILGRLRKLINKFNAEGLLSEYNDLQTGINKFMDDIASMHELIPAEVNQKLSISSLKFNDADSKRLKRYKRNKKIRCYLSFRFKTYRYSVKLADIVKQSLIARHTPYLKHILTKYGEAQLKFVIDIQRLIRKIHDNLLFIERDIDKLNKEDIEKALQEINHTIDLKRKQNNESFGILFDRYKSEYTGLIKLGSSVLNQVHPNRFIRKLAAGNKKNRKLGIDAIPAKWFNNQTLLFNNLLIELSLLSFEYQSGAIIRHTINNLNDIHDRVVHKPLNLIHDIVKSNDESGLEKVWDHKLIKNYKSIDPRSFVSISDELESSIRKLEYSIRKFPESIKVISEESYNNYLSVQFENVDVLKVSSTRLLDHILQRYLAQPVKEQLKNLPDNLSKSQVVVGDVIRVAGYISKREGEQFSVDMELGEEQLLDQLKLKVKDELEKSTQQKDEIIAEISKQSTSLQNQLSLHTFTHKAGDVKRYIKDDEMQLRSSKIKGVRRGISSLFKKMVNQFWYKQSWSLLFAKQVIDEKNTALTNPERISGMVQRITPLKKTLDKLPEFYLQLFDKKLLHYNEFWFGRETLIERFEKALDKYNSEHFGGVLIRGEHGSGKSFLAHYLTSQYFDVNQSYFIQPPYTGSIDADVFKSVFENELDIRGDYDYIFNNLPSKSVIVFEDVELWWEKAENGYEITKQLFQFIRQYKDKCLFVFVVNSHAFNLFRNIYDFESLFIDILECKPFDAESLQKIIMYRHQSSNFELANQSGIRLTAIGIARYFARLFNVSQGNINVALLHWLSNIKDVQNGKVQVKMPVLPDTSAFEKMNPLWDLIILQFLLHKHLNVDRLAIILALDKVKVNNELLAMKRSGLLIEIKDGVLKINPYIVEHIKSAMKVKELI